jgi:hypothetical protein
VQACREVLVEAELVGREQTRWQHGLHVWCGFGADRDGAGDRRARQMTALYQMPFEKFAAYSPFGTPADVAAALRPYVMAGCDSFNLVAVADDPERTVAAAAAVRALLSETSP